MTPKEIEANAMRGELLPHGLNQPEQLLFLSFRNLYAAYQSAKISKEQAQSEKQELLSAFDQHQVFERRYERDCKARVKFAGLTKEIEKGSCERCKLLLRIFDGREPV